MIKVGYANLDEKVVLNLDRYEKSSRKFYSQADDVIEEAVKIISKKNLLSNTQDFRNKVVGIKLKDAGVSCYRYASVVARLMDYYKIPYTFCIGKAVILKGNDEIPNPDDIAMVNHVWVYSNGKYYEYFNGPTTNVKHLEVTKEIKF